VQSRRGNPAACSCADGCAALQGADHQFALVGDLGMPRFVNFKDFKGQLIVVNADQVIYVRSFGSFGKTEIAFAAAQQPNGALCIVVDGTVESVTRELNGEMASGVEPARMARGKRSYRPSASAPERRHLVASRR
jgi:hypothetical protein